MQLVSRLNVAVYRCRWFSRSTWSAVSCGRLLSPLAARVVSVVLAPADRDAMGAQGYVRVVGEMGMLLVCRRVPPPRLRLWH